MKKLVLTVSLHSMNTCLVAQSCLLFVTPRTVARQAPLPMGFSWQEYWRGLLFLFPGDLPDPGIKPAYPALAEGFFTTEASGKPKPLSCVQSFVTPWTVTCQASLSMEFSRQEYWSGQPFLCPGNLLNPGIKPGSPALQADSLSSEPPGKPYSLTQASSKLSRITLSGFYQPNLVSLDNWVHF